MDGSLDDPDNIVIRPHQIWLNDIGTTVHTQFSNDPDAMVDMYDKHPEFIMSRMGLIHSHNSMGVFFSGEDVDELHDNSPSVDFYFSLITNNRGEYEGRIATIRVDEVATQTVVRSKWQRTGQELAKGDQRSTGTRTIEVLHMIKLEVVMPEGINTENEIILDRLKYVKEEEEKKRVSKIPTLYQGFGNDVRVIPPGKDAVLKQTSRVPSHVSPRQLGFNGKTVAEDTALGYDLKEILAQMLVGDVMFTGSLKKAIKKVRNEVDDAFAEDFVIHFFEAMEGIYLEATGEDFMSTPVEVEFLTYISEHIPDDCIPLTKLKERARKELIEQMSGE